MHRAKKEEARKRREAREGLSASELQELEQSEARKREVECLTRDIHFDLFPEEYNYMMDSISDAKGRRLGRNAMSTEYIECVNGRCIALGVSPLAENGMPVSNKSWTIASPQAERKTHHDATAGNS